MKSAKSLKDKFVFTLGFVLFLLIIKLKTELKQLVTGGIFPQSDKSQSLRSRTHVMWPCLVCLGFSVIVNSSTWSKTLLVPFYLHEYSFRFLQSWDNYTSKMYFRNVEVRMGCPILVSNKCPRSPWPAVRPCAVMNEDSRLFKQP